jgi:hypothetical protein
MIISASIFVAFDTVYLLVNQDFFTVYQDCQVEQMQAEGKSEEEINATVKQMEMMSGATGIIVTEIIMFLTVGFIGFIISLISAAVLRK